MFSFCVKTCLQISHISFASSILKQLKFVCDDMCLNYLHLVIAIVFQNPSNNDHVMAASGVPLSGGMSAGGHMMDDMMDDPHMGHMSMMPNSMGGMRTMMSGEQMVQGGAGRMGSSQWLQQQQQQFQQHQQMRCMQSEYQRYPHMSQQAMGMYGGNLPPQVQRVRMNFQGGMAHPQGFGGDGMMMQYGSMSHLQQQQQQQMVLNQKRMQLKTQMGAVLRPNAGPSPMSATSVAAQRGIGQMPVEMPPQQPPAVTPQQPPALPCSLALSMSSQAGLRTTHGLAKRAPSPRRPPPHYTDTVSMQSMARRTVTGMMAVQHGTPEMNTYGADHLRFPVGMVPDYGSSIGAPQMDNVQQFSNSTHGALPRFPNNMPQ